MCIEEMYTQQNITFTLLNKAPPVATSWAGLKNSVLMQERKEMLMEEENILDCLQSFSYTISLHVNVDYMAKALGIELRIYMEEF